MAHRYFLTEIVDNTAIVSGSEAAHLIKVMRVKPGDEVILTDKTGFDYTAQAVEISGNSVVFNIVKKQPNPAEPHKKLTVFMALPKSDKMEFITQKMCELGARELVPFVSQYCVAQKSKKDDNKIQRLQKISDEACKQSGRSVPMEVKSTLSFNQMLENLKTFDKVILFYEHGTESLANINMSDCNNVAVIIGSEGGFSRQEAEQMEQKGAKNVILGSRILRCETAAVTARSLVMFTMGELG